MNNNKFMSEWCECETVITNTNKNINIHKNITQ